MNGTKMKIEMIRVDDWAWLFMDDKLVDEGHSIDACDILSAVSDVIDVEYHYWEPKDDPYGDKAVSLCHVGVTPADFPREEFDD